MIDSKLLITVLVVLLALSLYSEVELANIYAYSGIVKFKPKDSTPKKPPMKIKIRF